MTQYALFEDAGPLHANWRADRQAALIRLSEFLPFAAQSYAKRRNFDHGPDNRTNVSCLSPWICHRALTEEEVLAAVLTRFSAGRAEKFVQEVFWRGYFKGYLEQHPSIWTHYKGELEAQYQRLEQEPELKTRYETAISGTTGIACFDAWARELVAENYLHNHARMWFASIWIFTLRLPWQMGAGFFLSHLLDGDSAANTLSWRWVGGLHTKGKNYCARADNIDRFTDGRFTATAGLAEDAMPLSETIDHPRVALPQPQASQVDGRHGVLLTEADCSMESLNWPTPPAAIAVLPALDSAGPSPLAPAVLKFRNLLLADAKLRVETTGNCPATLLGAGDPAVELRQWAHANDLQSITLSRPPIGPVRDMFEPIKHLLESDGVAVNEFQHPYDTAVWPHSHAGFFKLRKKIPQILETLAPRLAKAVSGLNV